LGLIPEELAALKSRQTAWETAYTNHRAAQIAAQSACRGKDNSRKSSEFLLRQVTPRLQVNPMVTDEVREALKITASQTQRTSVGTPSSRPLGQVDIKDRFQHVIHFVDEESQRRRKPAGVFGCKIWVKLGDAPPTDPSSELKFLGTNTSTPFKIAYQGVDAGKTAHYMLRWVNKRGKTGLWSPTVSAIIQG